MNVLAQGPFYLEGTRFRSESRYCFSLVSQTSAGICVHIGLISGCLLIVIALRVSVLA